jgi:hypothetical protein
MNCFGEVIFYSFNGGIEKNMTMIRKIVSGTSEYNFKKVFAVYWAFVIANIQNDSNF